MSDSDELAELRKTIAALTARLDKLESQGQGGIKPHDADRLSILEADLAKLRADVVQINHPQKWIFFASPRSDADNSGIEEYVPAANAAGDAINWTHGNEGNRVVDAGADAAAMVTDADDAALVAYMAFRIAPGKFGYVRITPRRLKGLLPVALTKTSGSDGTDSTAATWIYTVDGAYDGLHMTGVSPVVARPKGKLIPAEWGIGYYPPGGGNFILLYAFEIPDTDTCPDPP